MRKIVSSAATAVAAKSLDGRLLSKEGIARLVDNVVPRTTGRESWEKGRIESNSITSSVQVETDLTIGRCHLSNILRMHEFHKMIKNTTTLREFLFS